MVEVTVMSISSMSRHGAAVLLALASATLLAACAGERTPLEPITGPVDAPASGSTGAGAPANGAPANGAPAPSETQPAGSAMPAAGLGFYSGSSFGTVGTRLLFTP